MSLKRNSASATQLLKVLLRHLNRRRRLQLGIVLGLTIISACTEVISLGAVLPFLGVLTAPASVFRYPLIKEVAHWLGIGSPDQLVLPVTIAFAAAAILGGIVRIVLLWVNTRVAYSIGADLSTEIYRRTLYQPYCVHIMRNSNEVISGITVKVNAVVFGVLLQMLIMAGSLVILIAIMATLVVINPTVALSAAAGFGSCYGVIAWVSRHRLEQNSQVIAHEQNHVIKALREGLGGIRDVLLDGTQAAYCNIYQQADHPMRRALGTNVFLGGSPRFAMEALGTVLIASLAYLLSRESGGVRTALPILGALAFGAQRLLPALQQSYNAWASIAGNRASLADTLEFLDQPLAHTLLLPPPPPLVFQREILFKAVSFRYASDGPLILNNLSLSIPKGMRVGIAGCSGSGKSTTLDLLLGLLVPTSGEILIDGQRIQGNLTRAWQRNIAHVPQSIYLADSSILENIAFGVPSHLIEPDRVKRAAQQAQIADFIESYPDGYDTVVGERGIRMSGGQRQRIGIARALYKQATVLVFDEATSALDHATELSVMEAIENLDRQLTILLVTHRLSTLKICDFVVLLGEGRVIAQGTYETLVQSSTAFRQLAQTTI